MPEKEPESPILEGRQQFVDDCTRFVKENLRGRTQEVKINNKELRGYKFSDFVITVSSTKFKDSFEVVRNRTGAVVLAVHDGVLKSLEWEYIFIQEHLHSLLPNQG